jgi:hypothetical protein
MTLEISKLRTTSLAAAAVCCLAAGQSLLAADPATSKPNVTYTATGTFGTPQISGLDQFKLAGQPFTISVVGNEALTPTSSGTAYATFSGLTMSATITSDFSGVPTPFVFQNHHASMELAVGNPNYDVIAITSPIFIGALNLQLTFLAEVQLPHGTLQGDHINPFTAPYTFTPTSVATFTYSCPTTITQSGCTPGQSTTLSIPSGTFSTTVK